MRPLKKASKGFTHLPVVVDKFTKWIEAKPAMKLKSLEATSFFHDIDYHFRVLNFIITDNRTKFIGEQFLQCYDNFNICIDWATMAHP